jgi:hypothetical protein
MSKRTRDISDQPSPDYMNWSEVEQEIEYSKLLQKNQKERMKSKSIGRKGVAEPAMPSAIECFENEPAFRKAYNKEMKRYIAEKREQLEKLFKQYNLKIDDWQGLAIALAETYVKEYRTNKIPGAKVKRWPMTTLIDVIMYAVQNNVGVTVAGQEVYPDPSDYKRFEEIRAAHPLFWREMKSEHDLK